MAGLLLWSGYRAAIANQLTTELNSLADANVTALSTEYDNTTNKDTFADFQLNLASLTVSSTSAFVTVFVVPSVDGATYPDFASGTYLFYHSQYARGSAWIKTVTATTAQANIEEVRIPPGKFKVALRNGTGASFASSGNTLGMRTYSGAYT